MHLHSLYSTGVREVRVCLRESAAIDALWQDDERTGKMVLPLPSSVIRPPSPALPPLPSVIRQRRNEAFFVLFLLKNVKPNGIPKHGPKLVRELVSPRQITRCKYVCI